MDRKLKVTIEDDGKVTVEGSTTTFRAQASHEVEIELQLDGYNRVFYWRGALPRVRPSPCAQEG